MSNEDHKKSTEAADANLEKVRKKCLTRGFSSMKCFSSAFRQFDRDFSKQINFAEFQEGLERYGIDNLTVEQQLELFRKFDKDSSGHIDFQEFFQKLAPPLPEKRKAIISYVFSKLDKNGDGSLQTDDIIDLLTERAKRHPRYQAGDWSERDVIQNLLAAFEQPDSQDGVVTLQEFTDYYAAVSSCVQDDHYFEAQIKGCWGVK